MNTRFRGAKLDDLLSHWLVALPILLIVCALGSGQIDLYPPTVDEFFSMNDAGWLAENAWSPTQIVDSLLKDGPQHTPGYFLLLSAWGSLTNTEIALARVLTLYCALLSLSLCFRLGQSFIAPIGGLFALLIIGGNAFYNFYFAHARMYPLLTLCACAVLWLYLRLATTTTKPRHREYAALFLAVFALVNVHAFSATFLLSLGLVHLVLVKKDRRWLGTSLAVTAAVILFLPYARLLMDGYDQFTKARSDLITDGMQAIATWLTLATNDAPVLLLPPLAGLAFGLRRRLLKPQPHILLILPFLLLLALVAENSEAITRGGMRYQLAGMPLFALFIAAGVMALFRIRRWLALLLILLWLGAGLAFQQNANWWDYLPGRSLAFSQPPTQVLSRLARSADPLPALLGYPLDSFYSQFALRQGGYINYAQAEHFFDRHNIIIHATDSADDFDTQAQALALNAPAIWHFYRAPQLSQEQARFVSELMDELGYAPCSRTTAGKDTMIDQYRWRILRCQNTQPQKTIRGDGLEYQFYGAQIADDGKILRFVDRWRASQDSDLARLNMSWQLLNADWQNIAQLDLPLVNDGDLRQFSIDISTAPAGDYRLMAIVYDSASGEKQTWRENHGDIPTMAHLTTVALARS